MQKLGKKKAEPKTRGRKKGSTFKQSKGTTDKINTASLSQTHKQFIYEYVFTMGRVTKRDLCQKYGLAESTISSYMNEKNQSKIALAFREEYRQTCEEFKKTVLTELENKAFKELNNVFLYSKDMKVRLDASKFILEKLTENTVANKVNVDVDVEPIQIVIDYGDDD